MIRFLRPAGWGERSSASRKRAMPFYVVSLPPSSERQGGPPWRGGPRVMVARLAAALTGAPPASFAVLAPGGRANQYATRDEAHRALRGWRRAFPLHDVVVAEAATFHEAQLIARSPDGGPPPLAIEQVQHWTDMQQALAIRHSVFVDEQGVPEEEEIDEHDLPKAWSRSAVHVLGRLGHMPVVTARLLLDAPPGQLPHIGRVAVLKEYRGRGYGRAIVETLHDEARRRGFPGVTLAAQLHAVPFYERLGYTARGEIFLDAGIEHRDMDLTWS